MQFENAIWKCNKDNHQWNAIWKWMFVKISPFHISHAFGIILEHYFETGMLIIVLSFFLSSTTVVYFWNWKSYLMMCLLVPPDWRWWWSPFGAFWKSSNINEEWLALLILLGRFLMPYQSLKGKSFPQITRPNVQR